jgi:hypothetical protein
MPKKCTICGGEATFQIKGSSDYYCEDCAKENFSDLDLLEKVAEQASKLKSLTDEE